MPVAGVIWYQGCNNVGRDQMYEVCFKNMIKMCIRDRLFGERDSLFISTGYCM